MASSSQNNVMEAAKELAGIGDADEIGFIENLKAFPQIWLAAKADERAAQINRLYKALQIYVDIQKLAYNYTYEAENYLTPAKAMAKRGFEAIVFGHTHLVKRVNLAEVNAKSVYFNSGTWADLIFLPESLIQGNEVQAKLDLEKLASDLADNKLDDWRKLVPSFIQIDLEGDKVVSSEAFIFNSSNNIVAVSPKQ